jgi:hypothetical protein
MMQDFDLDLAAKRPTLYLAHPVGSDPAGNYERAHRWLRWWMDVLPDAAINCPWLPFLRNGSDTDWDYRTRCLKDDLAIAATCAGILLCGGVVSSGMGMEKTVVLKAGGQVFNFTHLGDEPPAFVPADVLRIRRMVMRALMGRPLRARVKAL